MNAEAPHPYIRKLNRILERMGGLYTASDLLSEVKAGRMQMFCEGETIAITQINVFPRASVLDIIAVVGNIEHARKLHGDVLKFAETMNLGVVRAYGRAGWLGDALRNGWTVKAQSFVYQRDM